MRQLPKKRAVKLLNHIYDELHPCELGFDLARQGYAIEVVHFT